MKKELKGNIEDPANKCLKSIFSMCASLSVLVVGALTKEPIMMYSGGLLSMASCAYSLKDGFKSLKDSYLKVFGYEDSEFDFEDEDIEEEIELNKSNSLNNITYINRKEEKKYTRNNNIVCKVIDKQKDNNNIITKEETLKKLSNIIMIYYYLYDLPEFGISEDKFRTFISKTYDMYFNLDMINDYYSSMNGLVDRVFEKAIINQINNIDISLFVDEIDNIDNLSPDQKENLIEDLNNSLPKAKIIKFPYKK